MVAFRCYNPGGNERDAWRDAIPPVFDAEVDAAMEVRERERTLDNERYFKELRGDLADLTEVLIDFELEQDDPRVQKPAKGHGRRSRREQVHIRILGFGNVDDFVLLYGFRKDGGPHYGPAGNSAINRKVGVEKDGRRAQPCRFT